MSTIYDVYAPYPVINHSKINVDTDKQLLGVELEIEAVRNAEDLVENLPIQVTTDGSLRNNGYEFITQPINLSTLKWALEIFFKRGKFTEESYSERTSVHVHANCQDLTKDEVYSILLTYQVFERLLYAWCGGDRDKNIFCVPWNQTNLPNLVLRSKALDKLKNWQKYTGLNILPLTSKGTIEFRHMAGTNDLNKIVKWCELISCLFDYGKRYKVDHIKETIVTLNTNSMYAGFLMDVFQGHSEEFLNLFNYRAVLEEGVLDTKYAIMVPKTEVKVDNPFEAAFDVEQAQAGVELMRQQIQRERDRQRGDLALRFINDPVQAAPQPFREAGIRPGPEEGFTINREAVFQAPPRDPQDVRANLPRNPFVPVNPRPRRNPR